MVNLRILISTLLIGPLSLGVGYSNPASQCQGNCHTHSMSVPLPNFTGDFQYKIEKDGFEYKLDENGFAIRIL